MNVLRFLDIGAGDEGSLRLHVVTADVLNMPLPDHRQCLVACQRSSGGSQAGEAEPQPHQPLDPPMILLNDVVQRLALPQP